jgi:hypothetical protein
MSDLKHFVISKPDLRHLLRISTSPLFALFTCCWMSFEAVLGNKEFELVVFGVTFAVVTRRSASGHGVSVLSVGMLKYKCTR